MKNYQDMTDKEFKKFLKMATYSELVKAFCEGKTHEQIESDIRKAEAIQ